MKFSDTRVVDCLACMAWLAAGCALVFVLGHAPWQPWLGTLSAAKAQPAIVTGVGCLAGLLGWGVRQRMVQPWRRIRQTLLIAHDSYQREAGSLLTNMHSPRVLAQALGQLATHAQQAHAQTQLLQRELDQARLALAHYQLRNDTLITTANRELMAQYQHVVAYAHYLDEHILRHAPDAQLRYDFDDICESGFNLKLIAQSLEMLRASTPRFGPVAMDALVSQTMLALAPTLERRSMQLSTLGMEVGIIAETDHGMLAHVLWMMLLGAVRYAAAESTLRLRCLEVADGAEVMLSIVVSELSPGTLTAAERHAHLARQLEHLTPHLFAETLRLHGNLQLAELLLQQLAGRIRVHPITHYACEICLYLPAHGK